MEEHFFKIDNVSVRNSKFQKDLQACICLQPAEGKSRMKNLTLIYVILTFTNDRRSNNLLPST